MTVATYDAGVQRRSRRYGMAIAIESIGDTNGVWYICSRVPDWAAGSAQWKPWLRKPWPAAMPERPPPLGGVSEGGDIQVHVLDRKGTNAEGQVTDGLLTDQLRTEALPTTYLAVDVLPADASITLVSTAGMITGTVLHIGAEAMRVTNVVSGTVVDVTRAFLMTDALNHYGPESGAEMGDAVRIRTGFVRSRRIYLYKYPLDGVDATTMRLLDTFFLDRMPVAEDFVGYTIRGRSQRKHLSRQVSRVIRRGVFEDNMGPLLREEGDIFRAEFPSDFGASQQWTLYVGGPAELYVKAGAEILHGTVMGGGFYKQLERGVCSTPRLTRHEAGEPCVEVFVADTEIGVGSFRYSPGPTPATDRADATEWVPTANWIDILLILLTSSADWDDGLELLNYRTVATGGIPAALQDAERSNWSSLPPGIGVGLPVAQIDIVGALDIRARTLDALFPNFYVGDEPVEFGELVTEKLLEPMGAYLTYSGGSVRVVLPRVPLLGSLAFDIGTKDILTRSVGKLRRMPELTVEPAMDLLVGQVSYKTKSRSGAEVTRSKLDRDFGGTYGQRGFYGADEGGMKLDASAARASNQGDLPWLEQRIGAGLFRFRRPPFRVQVSTHDTLYAILPGQNGTIYLPETPNPVTGRRGVTVFAEVLSKEEVTEERGSYLEIELLGYPAGSRVGRIAPSARSSGSAPSGGNTAVTVEANRYTAPDATGGLPSTDAAGFAINQVVQCRLASGVATGSTRTIISIVGNVITLSGATAVPAGQTICFAAFPSQLTTQQSQYASMASGTTRQLTGGIAPFQYGEV